MRLTTVVLLLLSIVFCHPAAAQTIYSKAYGKPGNPALIYIHGGPRGNATLFEGTTAETLAEKGFYVIVYDRRGEGRSIDTTATFTFQEAFNDLNNLISTYNLQQVSLIGHSFGGIVSTLYTAAYPEKVKRLILTDALFSQQETYDHILLTTGKLAMERNDSATLQKIALIKQLNKNSAGYRKKCYEVASVYGYFDMPSPTTESRAVHQQYEDGPFRAANIRNDTAPVKFYQNEKQVNIDTRKTLKKIQQKGVQLFAIYGRQDRIFSEKQFSDMRNLVGKNNFYSIENCSHYPFADQRAEFLEDIKKIMQ